MLGSTTARARTCRQVATALVLACAPALALTSPAAADDLLPVITNVQISPVGLPSNGGTVTVTADVSDGDGSVTSVGVSAYGPASFSAPMLRIDGDAVAGTYSGSFDIGPNFGEEPVGYQIEITATDDVGESALELVGDVTVEGTTPFDEKPIVSDPSVSPTSLPASGGPVSLAFSAWDLRGISEASATITRSITGSPTVSYHVPLEGISADRFAGVFTAPANTSVFPAFYEVEFSAMDDVGQQSTISGETVIVAARPAGQLEIKPGDRNFGKVKRGRIGRRTIVVKNRTPKGSPPVAGLIQTSGAPFSVVGQTNAGVAFSLKPGQSRTYHLQFRPTALGAFSGRVNVVRTDFGQPFLHARLAGRGT